MTHTLTPLDWVVGFSSNEHEMPCDFIGATVPGAVQLDWARAQGWPDPYWSNDVQRYEWMEDVYWVYRTRIDPQSVPQGGKVFLVSKGIDYRFRVMVNGVLRHEQEGMFTPVKIDLTGLATTGCDVHIVVFPAPKSGPLPTRAQADQSCKPAVSYGWDFHPRLIPLGIWDETGLLITGADSIESAELSYALSANLDIAELTFAATVATQNAATLRWTLSDKEGIAAVQLQTTPGSAPSVVLQATLPNPHLWWPNGQGEPYLYTWSLELLDKENNTLDTRTGRCGFRTVKLVMAPGQWTDPEVGQTPVGPNKPPITVEINGRAIFAKGSNWVSPEIFPGLITQLRCRTLLTMARDAHFNLVRCWGGAVVQKECFFDIADELGLLVWQEFPLACNRYSGTPQYLGTLDKESRSIITRLRHHPCLALWCGGNELYNNWSKMTEQDLALRLLNRNCYDLDRDRPFLMTSPLYGMGHGNYLFLQPDGREVFDYFARSRCTAYTEFGVPGPAPLENLQRMIPQEELFPVSDTPAWRARHAFGAWDGSVQSWLEPDCIESYFGKADSLETLVKQGQFMQAQGLRIVFEEARRQHPFCSMALNWCFNEPWPTAANSSIIAWPDTPKPAYETVRQALRPQLASARIPRFCWQNEDQFEIELFMLNDSPHALSSSTLKVSLEWQGSVRSLRSWEYPCGEPANNLVGPRVSGSLDGVPSGLFSLVLHDESHPERDSTYTLLLRNRA